MSRQISLLLAFLFALSGSSLAQDKWPSKPIRWIVPYAAGGFADIRARELAIDLAKNLGQPVFIENRAGAGGVIGSDAVAKAAPDGYTIGMGNLAALAVNVSLMKKLPYDPLKGHPARIAHRAQRADLCGGPGPHGKQCAGRDRLCES